MTARGVLISWATPAASRPMELSLSACASCVSSETLSVMSSTRMMRPDGDEIPRKQRSDGDVGRAQLAGPGGEWKLVEVMHAGLVAEALEGFDELRRKDLTKRLADEPRRG